MWRCSKAVGVVRNTALGLKVLGEGELSKKLEVKAAKFSAPPGRRSKPRVAPRSSADLTFVFSVFSTE